MVMTRRVRGGELPLSMTLVDPELHYGQISTTGRCTTHGPCSWTPNHHVWYFVLFWVLFAVCGGIWVRSWEEASYMSDLWEDFPVPEQWERLSCHVSTVKCGFLE